MSRRKLPLFVGLTACLAALGLTVWLLWPRTAITRENAAQIQKGMTLAEVEAILGGPARDETSGVVTLCADADAPSVTELLMILDVARGPAVAQPLQWQSDRAAVWVHIDAGGCVTDCVHFTARRVPESPLDMLRRWLGL